MATGMFWEPRKHDSVFPLLEIKTRFVGSLAHCVVTFVAGLSWLTEEEEEKKEEEKKKKTKKKNKKNKKKILQYCAGCFVQLC